MEKIQMVIEGASYLVTGATVLAALLPIPKVSKVLQVVRRVLDLLAFNIGNAKNAGQ